MSEAQGVKRVQPDVASLAELRVEAQRIALTPLKIDALRSEIRKLQARRLSATPLANLTGAIWVVGDTALAVSLGSYGVASGLSFDARGSSMSAWQDIAVRLVPWIIGVWIISLIMPLITLRHYKTYWIAHSVLKFPSAVAAIAVGFFPAMLLREAEIGLFFSLVWLCIGGFLVTIAYISALGGYTKCDEEIESKINTEIKELERQIAELTPKLPEAKPLPPPPPLDNIID